MEITQKLLLNAEVTRRVLVAFLRRELERFGFRRAVLNLSGGVDSALACFLTAEALGGENVLALLLPYRTSTPESAEHARQVIELTGVSSKTIDITPMVEPYFEQYQQMSDVRRGNVMARMRMIVLYDHSVQWEGLPIGTSNKTELLLGYGTLFGDMASAVNPLGDLYKTQVRQMARAVGVPEAIIQKAPSADLWVGQTDEGELGFTYAEVDKLLYLLVDERYKTEEAIAAGFDRQFVETVVQRMRASQFKRMPPVVAKVSRRDVGHDFLYPRDWGT
ncbi:MAG: NAD+ synthase [Anaerolineales bacterium]|nr:MAG: NAD+ synthase [Anaerolineales bacterium]